MARWNNTYNRDINEVQGRVKWLLRRRVCPALGRTRLKKMFLTGHMNFTCFRFKAKTRKPLVSVSFLHIGLCKI